MENKFAIQNERKYSCFEENIRMFLNMRIFFNFTYRKINKESKNKRKIHLTMHVVYIFHCLIFFQEIQLLSLMLNIIKHKNHLQ